MQSKAKILQSSQNMLKDMPFEYCGPALLQTSCNSVPQCPLGKVRKMLQMHWRQGCAQIILQPLLSD